MECDASWRGEWHFGAARADSPGAPHAAGCHRRQMIRVLQRVGRLLAPPACVFCAGNPGTGRTCAGCRDDLPWLGPACPACAEPFAVAQAAGVTCVPCQQQPPPWERCVAAFHYAFPVDCAVRSLKFRHRLHYAPALAELLLPSLGEHFADADLLCPVPLHRRRQVARGYNQAREICRLLARRSGLPISRAVTRVRHTRAQTGLDRASRRRNLRGAFRATAQVVARHVLIVDDVMTTGETCRHVTQALHAAGCERVSVLVVARVAQGAAGTNV